MAERPTPAPAGAPREPAPPASAEGAALPVLYLVSAVLFPGGTAQAQIRTKGNLLHLSGHPDPETLFLFVFAPGADPEHVSTQDFARVAVVGRVVSRVKLPDGSFQVAVQGLRRARVARWSSTKPALEAIPAEAVEEQGRREAVDASIFQILNEFELLVRLGA
jgi:ATP-dependent Lon protease